MAAHLKEHPLAGRRVVMNSDLAYGALVYVVDWLDRLGLAGDSDAVFVRDSLGGFPVSASELPNYDPVPVGYV